MTTTTETPAARTGYTRFLGACPKCSTGIAREDGQQAATCGKCGTVVTLRRVSGVYSAAMPCDDRCQYAIGNCCSCSCGGPNHGRGYIAPIGERPEWVLQRDAKRHAAKVEREAAKTARHRRSIEDRQAELLAEFPVLAWLSYLDDADMNDGSDFMADMITAFEIGKMSERQAAAAVRAVERETGRRERREAREARDAALLGSGFTYPTGRTEVVGEIVTIRDEPGYAYNSTDWKCLVVTESGWKVWMTLPRTLIDWANERRNEYLTRNPGGQDSGWSAYLKGRTVAFTANLQGKEGDPLFGYGSRPTKARVLEDATV